MNNGEDIFINFQIRSEDSYSQSQRQRCYSTKSQQQISFQISDTIQNMIEQQKKKYKISKTQNKIQKQQSVMKMKKFYSISTLYALKPTLVLPLHISKIFNSHKRYPNVPILQKDQRRLDTIYGAFFGFLIGDVTGAYLAYTNQRLDLFLPSALLMNGGGTYNLGAGQGTDQTQILFTVAYGLIQGKGQYNQNVMARKYLQWIDSKPFNFSTIIALPLRQLRKFQESDKFEQKKMGKVLRQASLKNMKFQSSIGLIRILPLVVFSLKFNENEFQKIIKQQLSLICPNHLVFQTGYVYAKALRIIILLNDHQKAFYEVSKWVYEEGCPKLKQLWRMVEYAIQIQSRGNMGRLKTSFTYACIELSKKQINFFQILSHNLQRGGDTDANCAIVMTLVGAIVGYNGIPGYFKQKIINSRMKDSPRPRNQIYATHNVINVIQSLLRVQPNRLFNIS